VWEVARGLAARGHDMHVVIDAASEPEPLRGVTWHRVSWSPRQRCFRFRARAAVAAIAGRSQADALIERYYNFGGEGIRAAREVGIPSVLEVNSPVVDHPGSLKGLVDRLLLVRPMRRYRESLCRDAAALLTPLASIVPEAARSKAHVVTWGADVDGFTPARRSEALRAAWGVPQGATVVLFMGSFRPWHGVPVFEAAAASLVGRTDLFFVLAGGEDTGPARGFRGRRLGKVPYAQMPEVAASADIGAAPYDTARLAQLRLGFYWSPLKVFEYMASGLPVVTIARAPLSSIVREGQEAVFFADGDATSLANALVQLAGDAALRQRLGRSARDRVVANYSWAAHCAQVEGVLRQVVRA
jgi:glycosyltransferase involved in cell wall biosynthesis